MTEADEIAKRIDPDRPVLIAGPTASGKSSLAMAIAARTGGCVVNADALQVYGDWRILTARPSRRDEARVPHALYGHVPGDRAYSVGDWMRDVLPLLEGKPPVIVGGTGLYFAALTEGLADIPETPAVIREEASRRISAEGPVGLLAELDTATRRRIDPSNLARVQRAWEVLRATGRGLADWQASTPPPRLPISLAQPLLIEANRDWLISRISRRVDQMLEEGALEEARGNLAGWTPDRPSAKAIGAAELMAHLAGRLDLATVRERMIVQTRQYAKRQRTWFRARMGGWKYLPAG